MGPRAGIGLEASHARGRAGPLSGRPDAWRCQGGDSVPLGGVGDWRDRTVGNGAIEPDGWPGIGHDVAVTTDLVTPGPTGPESDRPIRSVRNPCGRSPCHPAQPLRSASNPGKNDQATGIT
jgi:hypothetical protein